MKLPVTIAAVSLLALTATACDQIGEQLFEEGAEQLTGADIEADDEGISIETDEGSFEANEDGVTIEGEDGSFQAGAQMPEDFPSAVPQPEGGELLGATRVDTADGLAWALQYEFTSGGPSEVLQDVTAALEAEGFTQIEGSEQGFSSGDDGGEVGGASYEGQGYSVNITVIGATDEFVLSYNVSETSAG